MSVEFDNDQHKSILYAKLLQQSDEAPSIINWVLKSGIAKTPEGANKILVCVTIFSFCLTCWTMYKTWFVQPAPTQEESSILHDRLMIRRH